MREPASADAADRPSLARQSIRGAAWNYGGAAVIIVGQLAYTALTARLVSPAEFGAYATAQALLSLVGYFTLSTVGNAIIRHPALDRKVVGTGWVMTAAAGATVAVVVIVVAGFWAEIWRSPGATTLLRLFAPQVLLTALAIVPLSLLRRELRFRSASLIETSSVLIGFGVGAVLAWRLRTAEALVVGQVATAGVLLLLGVAASRPQLAIAYSRAHARSLFSFSAQVSLQNLGHYLNNTLPTFAVSRFLGQTSLGFFSRGSLLVGLPLTFLAQGVNRTLYPIYPRFRERHDECRRMLVDVTDVTTTLVWTLFGALAGLAPLVVELLLGAQWAPVATIVGPLCLYATMNFVYSIFTSVAEVFAYLKQIWFVQICWALVLIVSLGVAVAGDASMRTIVLVAAGVQLGAHALQIALLAQARIVDAVGTLRAEGSSGLLALVWYLITMLTTEGMSEQSLGARVGVSCGVLLLMGLTTWLVLPYLPAGRALTRRGIPLGWLPRISGLS